MSRKAQQAWRTSQFDALAALQPQKTMAIDLWGNRGWHCWMHTTLRHCCSALTFLLQLRREDWTTSLKRRPNKIGRWNINKYCMNYNCLLIHRSCYTIHNAKENTLYMQMPVEHPPTMQLAEISTRRIKTEIMCQYDVRRSWETLLYLRGGDTCRCICVTIIPILCVWNTFWDSYRPSNIYDNK